jgi:hypothetical protein
VFATSQAEAKVVVAEQKLFEVEAQLAKDQADHAAEVKRLTDEIDAGVAAHREVSRKLEEVEVDRRWLISHGFSYVLKKLMKSVEFLRPIGKVQQAVWDSGCHNGLLAGHGEAMLPLKAEASTYYNPGAGNALTAAVEELDATMYSYLRAVAGTADKSIDELKALELEQEENPSKEQGAAP